jgi:hypothetical protein
MAVRTKHREIGEIGLGGARDVERNAMMALDEVGASFAVGVLEVEATNLTRDATRCPADCGDLLALKLGITLAGKVTSLKQPSFVHGSVIKIELSYLNRFVETTTMIKEVTSRFAVTVLGEELSSSEPVELLHGDEYVGGSDVWLDHRASVDKLVQGITCYRHASSGCRTAATP